MESRPRHTTLLQRWINVIDVDSTLQQSRVTSGVGLITGIILLKQCHTVFILQIGVILFCLL